MMTVVHYFIRMKDLAQDVTGASRPMYLAAKPWSERVSAFTFSISQAQRYARTSQEPVPDLYGKGKAELLHLRNIEAKYIPVVSAIAEHLERGWPIT